MRIPVPFRSRASRAERSRGQSLVEFAITLPVLLVLTLVALDFGRVYLGYINVQNMTRIAANYAANNPDAWGTTPSTKLQAQYRNQILADATATNCDLPKVSGKPVVPTPAFADANADGDAKGLGDTVTVQITCTFGVITPVISDVLGGTVDVSAESNFPVKSGMSIVKPVVVIIPAPQAAFIANDATVSPDPLTVLGPDVSVSFRDTSGGGPTEWAWDFGDGTTSKLQDVVHPFSCALPFCSYLVTLTSTNVTGDSTATMSVTVIGTSLVDFTSTSPTGTAPWTVTFTDASVAGGSNPTWDFGDGQTDTGSTVTHTYASTVGSPFTVSLTVTYPDPTGVVTTSKSGYVTVADQLCLVPPLTDVRFNNAQAIWQGAPYKFTGNVIRGPGAPSGNFIITAQSLTGGEIAPCDSDVTVNRP